MAGVPCTTNTTTHLTIGRCTLYYQHYTFDEWPVYLVPCTTGTKVVLEVALGLGTTLLTLYLILAAGRVALDRAGSIPVRWRHRTFQRAGRGAVDAGAVDGLEALGYLVYGQVEGKGNMVKLRVKVKVRVRVRVRVKVKVKVRVRMSSTSICSWGTVGWSVGSG